MLEFKTFFDLNVMRSYKVTGPSGIRYAIYKGQPQAVLHAEDAAKFRMHSDIFFECEEDGTRIAKEATNSKAKTYHTFRAETADIEDKLADAEKKAVEQRKAGVNVDELLKAAENDKIKKDEEDSDDKKDGEEDSEEKDNEKEDSEENEKAEDGKKKVKPIKKNALECEKCGRSDFKSKKEFEDHIHSHNTED